MCNQPSPLIFNRWEVKLRKEKKSMLTTERKLESGANQATLEN
jgi:hypothetical protein